MEQVSKRLMSWASIVEPEALEQAKRTSQMPFIHPHLALMPDVHFGKGATVGSVLPTLGAIMPAAVGVDIGCGMMAVRTQFTKDDVDRRGRANLHFLREGIEDRIPLSPGNYNTKHYSGETMGRLLNLQAEADIIGFDPRTVAGNWDMQLGSLGGGNHFIEVSLDEDDQVWLFLHSGSRGVGNKIATKHIKVAQRVMERYFISLPDPDLAYLVEGTDEFWAYINQMRWAQRFAYFNREEMMDRVVDATTEYFGEDVRPGREVNCHHNYTTREKHFGKEVWLSRKGAIDASEGTWGLIPGSMGDKSYVVVGKGNHLALNSAPHGAGRVLSRNKAKAKFDLDGLKAAMGDIEWSGDAAFLDEHPKAYKPIDQIMEDAADLVEVKHTLRQILNCKGQ